MSQGFSTSNIVSGTLPVVSGGTGNSSTAQGDILYADAANSLAKLAKNTTATRYLANTGTSNNPNWDQVNLTNGVTGTLAAGQFPALTGDVTTSAGSLATTVAAVAGSAIAGFRNRIINGDMLIDQWNAGTAFTCTTGVLYGAIDRWWNVSDSAASETIKQNATTDLDFPFSLRLQRPNASASTSIIYSGQIIESANCKDLANVQCTLSWYATAGANYSPTSSLMGIKIYTGTTADEGASAMWGGTWTGSVLNTNTTKTITTSRTKFSITFTPASNMKELGFYFYMAPTGTAGANDYVDITGVQLEVGAAATPFERIDYSTKLNQCRRYFQCSFPSGTQPKQNAGIAGCITGRNNIASGDVTQYVQFQPPLFKSPVVTTYNPSQTNANWRNITGSADVAVSVDSPSTKSTTGVIISTGATVVTIGQYLGIHFTAAAELT